MATVVVHVQDLGVVLRSLPKKDKAAVYRGLALAAKVDADRWIQWAIRGGGVADQAKAAKRAERAALGKKLGPKKPKGLAPRPTGLLAKIKQAFVAPKVLPKAKRAVARTSPAGYRVPIDTGDYARSWRSRVEADRIEVYSVAAPPVKAGVIEHGRRPAPIPPGALVDWVRRKLRVTDPKKAKSIAFAISRSAAKNRRPGLEVLRRAHPKIAEAARRHVERELRRAAKG